MQLEKKFYLTAKSKALIIGFILTILAISCFGLWQSFYLNPIINANLGGRKNNIFFLFIGLVIFLLIITKAFKLIFSAHVILTETRMLGLKFTRTWRGGVMMSFGGLEYTDMTYVKSTRIFVGEFYKFRSKSSPAESVNVWSGIENWDNFLKIVKDKIGPVK